MGRMWGVRWGRWLRKMVGVGRWLVGGLKRMWGKSGVGGVVWLLGVWGWDWGEMRGSGREWGG